MSVAYVATLVRVADRNYFSGVGAMFAMFAGLFLVSAGGSVVRGFERVKVYGEVTAELTPPESVSGGASALPDTETAGVAS